MITERRRPALSNQDLATIQPTSRVQVQWRTGLSDRNFRVLIVGAGTWCGGASVSVSAGERRFQTSEPPRVEDQGLYGSVGWSWATRVPIAVEDGCKVIEKPNEIHGWQLRHENLARVLGVLDQVFPTPELQREHEAALAAQEVGRHVVGRGPDPGPGTGDGPRTRLGSRRHLRHGA
ncbi:hypothetical protein ACFVWX_01325 [Streptomyces sp. NPDC058220]|uniref:hypothetical protein n=1 Tax=Streptomyces sp. NPDC058220 TaxID=3346387 RepID=UPI0036EE91E9